MSTRLAPIAAATLAAGAAGALAMACQHGSPGATLPAAGTLDDDGSGQLARASVKFRTSGAEDGFDPQPNPDTSYDYTYGYGYNGFTYGGFGGDWYGFGGSPYASYQPQVSYNVATRPVPYTVSYATDGGSLTGQVTWPKPPKVPATVPGAAGCDPVDTTLPLGAGNTVAGAVVYLERITSGRASSVSMSQKPFGVGGTVEARGCALVPRVQVLGPVPAPLVLSNGDAVPRSLRVESVADTSTHASATLEVGASRTVGVTASGVVRVVDEAGKLPPAWIVVAAHPYYTLTDAGGRFRLDDIAPGDYTVIAWFPPVVTGVADGVVQYGDPVVARKTVTIKKLAASAIDLAL